MVAVGEIVGPREVAKERNAVGVAPVDAGVGEDLSALPAIPSIACIGEVMHRVACLGPGFGADLPARPSEQVHHELPADRMVGWRRDVGIPHDLAIDLGLRLDNVPIVRTLTLVGVVRSIGLASNVTDGKDRRGLGCWRSQSRSALWGRGRSGGTFGTLRRRC